MSLQVFDFLFKSAHQGLEAIGQAVVVQLPLVTVAQHLAGPVFTGNDDPAATLDVKGIVGAGLMAHRGGLGMDQFKVASRWCPQCASGVSAQKICSC